MTEAQADKPKRAATMRYGLSVALGALTMLMVIIGVLGVTVWRPAQEVKAVGSPSEPYAITRVGVLSLYSDEIRVTVAGEKPTENVAVAVGQYNDVVAWLADKPYDEIVGLETLSTLKMQNHAGVMPDAAKTDDSDDSGSDLLKSDMWFDLHEGRGEVSFEVPEGQLDAALLVTTADPGGHYTVTLTWETPRHNILAWIAFILAALFLVLGLLTMVIQMRVEKSRVRRKSTLLERGTADTTETGMIEIVPQAVAQRRLEANAEQQQSQPGEVPADGSDADHGLLEETEDSAQLASAEDDDQDSEREEAERAEPKTDEDAAETESTMEEPPVELTEPEPGADARVETVSTDSGMINLAALQGGVTLPTRRALREANQRGVHKLVVEGKEYSTSHKTPEVSQAEEVLSRRPTRQVSSIFKKKRGQGEQHEEQ